MGAARVNSRVPAAHLHNPEREASLNVVPWVPRPPRPHVSLGSSRGDGAQETLVCQESHSSGQLPAGTGAWEGAPPWSRGADQGSFLLSSLNYSVGRHGGPGHIAEGENGDCRRSSQAFEGGWSVPWGESLTLQSPL